MYKARLEPNNFVKNKIENSNDSRKL